jgi:hypothetical protein
MMIFAYTMMVVGWGAMTCGFVMAGSPPEGRGWLGIALLFGGLLIAFSGVLLAFAPRFLS